MFKPFPFRALSPVHAGTLDLDYLLKVIEACRKYGFNAIQICGDGDLDGCIEFRRFPKANDVRDMEAVRRRRDILRRTCQAAHQHGLEVYLWHHELGYPQDMERAYPDWFVPAPDNRFRRDLYVKDRVPRIDPDAPFWEYLDAKFDEAFEQLPELDGTIMTIQESRVPIYCLFEDFEQQVAALADLYARLDRAHRRAGRKWVLRTFAWREHEYRVVTEAINRCRPAVPVESKGVPMDWSLYYAYDPLLGRFEWATKHVELAPSSEFHGCTYHPVGHALFYVHNLQFAAERGHSGAVLRIDRAGNSMLGGPDEGVLACVGAWLNDPDGTDIDRVYADWLMQRYGLDAPAAGRLLTDVLENCWNATLRCYHERKIYIGDSFWQKYDRLFFEAERHFCVEYDEPHPLAEKDAACDLADRAAATIAELQTRLRPEDHRDLARRVRFLQLTCRAYRALVAGLVARQKQMYRPSARNLAELQERINELESAGERVSAEFPELEQYARGSMGQRQPGALVREFARAWRDDLPNLKTRTVASRVTALRMGAGMLYQGRPACRLPAKGKRVTLKGSPGKGGVLAVFASTEMCVRRPLQISAGVGKTLKPERWRHRFDVGQFAWFLAHDRCRRYECKVPAECFDAEGKCTFLLTPPEPELAPYIAEMRLEVES